MYILENPMVKKHKDSLWTSYEKDSHIQDFNASVEPKYTVSQTISELKMFS